ncbi:Fur family transcriptional regulator [Bifidobacterium aquikefiricola]|uniref:Transcriptional repressor n=1 Tax=Bifidobacterium aquikefiricola TaxID=3059038 RepID=A0AB39U5N6_9BIFI
MSNIEENRTAQKHKLHKIATDWRSTLRNAHIRVTSQRLAVLSTLEAYPHSSAGEIIGYVNAGERENLTTQGTYVILQQLEQHGLVRRVSLPDSASVRWETRVADNHHHVQCVVCGRVEDVDCVVGHAPCLTPADTHDMEIFEAQIVFRGLCKECKAKIESGAIRKEDLPYLVAQ